MDNATQSPDLCSSIHWGDYIQNLIDQGLKPSVTRWYVIRAEHFLKSLNSNDFSLITAQDISQYLTSLDRGHTLSEWQFHQVIHAIQHLFRIKSINMDNQVDWSFWLDSSRSLSSDHPTIHREQEIISDNLNPIDIDTKQSVSTDLYSSLTALKAVIRRKHYAIKTEQTYVTWLKRFIQYHQQPAEALHASEVIQFLDHLAIQRKVTPSTQNLALNALVFYYAQVLDKPLGNLEGITRANKPKKLPVVLSREEIQQLLAGLCIRHRLMASLMYGTGMRLMECVRLRVQDIDFSYSQVQVRNAKGGKDRYVPLPLSLKTSMDEHLAKVKILHDDDLRDGYGEVFLPYALERKYPHANREWRWQYVFPSGRLSRDPRSGRTRRHHVDETGLQKAIKRANNKTLINKRVTSHVLRHSFATHLLEDG